MSKFRPKKAKSFYLFLAYLTPFILFLCIGNLYAVRRINSLKISGANPHTKFGRGGAYPPNLRSYETTYHGDLCVRAGYQVLEGKPSECPFSAGARSAWFVTDENGSKTLGDRNNFDYLLVGDSFLAATGGEKMTEQLGAVLTRETNYKFYESSFPGWGVDDYVSAIKKIAPSSKSVIILLYEGNDLIPLPPDQSLRQETVPSWKQSLRFMYAPVVNKFKDAVRISRQKMSNIPIFRLVYFYASGSRGVVDHGYKLKTIGNKLQAFFVPASDISAVDAKLADSHVKVLQSVADKVCLIVVIPSKHSTFLESSTAEARHPSFSRQIKQLRGFGIEVLDLTSDFQQAVIKNPSIDYWWSDDTHWRAPGIAYAANLISEKSDCLKR